jgi:hypothetical protein
MHSPLSPDRAPADFLPDRNQPPLNHAVSTEDAESFWTSGSDAVSAQPATIAHLSMDAAPEVGAPFSSVAPAVGKHAAGCTVDGPASECDYCKPSVETDLAIPATGRGYWIVSDNSGTRVTFFEDGKEAGGGFFPPPDEDGFGGHDEAVEYAESWVSGAAEPSDDSTSDSAVGVDLPGVGHVRAADCPAILPTVVRGRPYVAGEVSERLAAFVSDPPCVTSPGVIGKEVRELIAEIDAAIMRNNEKRDQTERLLTQLLFAARGLAERNVLGQAKKPIDGGLEQVMPAWCTECQMVEHLGKIPHAATCRTGRVLGILEALTSLAVKSDGKETGEEAGCAGDGIRPRGLVQRVCLKCGERGGIWQEELRPASEIQIHLLGLNQLVSDGPGDGETVKLSTHNCGKRKLRGVDALFGGRAKGGAR